MSMGIEEKAAKLDVKGIVVTMILSAFGFLVALQWRDAISATIDKLIPPGEGLLYSYMVAIVVTAIAVVVTLFLVKIQQADIIPERYEQKVKNGVKKSVRKGVKKTVRKVRRK